MIQGLMVLHRFISSHNFPAYIAGVGKISLEVFGFQMISHILPRFVVKVITQSTRKLFPRIVPHQNVLIKVFRICNVRS